MALQGFSNVCATCQLMMGAEQVGDCRMCEGHLCAVHTSQVVLPLQWPHPGQNNQFVHPTVGGVRPTPEPRHEDAHAADGDPPPVPEELSFVCVRNTFIDVRDPRSEPAEGAGGERRTRSCPPRGGAEPGGEKEFTCLRDVLTPQAARTGALLAGLELPEERKDATSQIREVGVAGAAAGDVVAGMGTEAAMPSAFAPAPTGGDVLVLVPIEVAPSKGSALHGWQACKPCAFAQSGSSSCKNGYDCQFCHLCEPGEMKRRKQAWKTWQKEMREERQRRGKTNRGGARARAARKHVGEQASALDSKATLPDSKDTASVLDEEITTQDSQSTLAESVDSWSVLDEVLDWAEASGY